MNHTTSLFANFLLFLLLFRSTCSNLEISNVNQAPSRWDWLSFPVNHDTAPVADLDGTINLVYLDSGRIIWSFSSGSPFLFVVSMDMSMEEFSENTITSVVDAVAEHKDPMLSLLPNEPLLPISDKSRKYYGDNIFVILIAFLISPIRMCCYFTPKAAMLSSSSSRKKKQRKSRKKNGNAEVDSDINLRLNFNHLIERDMQGCSIGKLFVSRKEIAKGGNGTIIFEGKYDGRKVAVKRLVRGPHDVAVEEIQNLIAADQHPNIVRYFGVEYDDDFVYLSFERCDCSLYDLIQMCSKNFQMAMTVYKGCNDLMMNDGICLWRPSGYPSPILLKLMRDIVSGLVHLHDLGIIHRDLKPHNVLLVKEKKSVCVKLSDMGISRRFVGDESPLGRQTSGSGSSGWQAPGQLLLGPQTLAIDMFRLGLVLFVCIKRGGRHPFGHHSERDSNITQKEVDLSLVKHIPEAVHLLSQLLNPNAELRPKASEVLHHPLFWNSERRMSFLRDTSDRLELEKRDVHSNILKALTGIASMVMVANWNNKMEATFINNMNLRRPYKYNSVQDLLRFIRNTLNHYIQLPKEIQKLLRSKPEGVDEYFASRFPKLLTEVYNVMYHYCKEEEWFHAHLQN